MNFKKIVRYKLQKIPKCILLFILVIGIIFIGVNLTGCKIPAEQEYVIKTNPIGSKVQFKEEILGTPAKIKIKGLMPARVKVFQPGYVSRNLLIKPGKSQREICLDLEPEIKEIIVETIPKNGVVRYRETEYKSGEPLNLGNEKIIIFEVIVKGYDVNKVKIYRSVLKEKYIIDLKTKENKKKKEKLKPSEQFKADLKMAISERDRNKVKSVIISFEKWASENPGLMEYPDMKDRTINYLGIEYYDNKEWDNLVFFLQNGLPGEFWRGPWMPSSYLGKAIEEDNVKLLETLIAAGAHINPELTGGGDYSEVMKCVESGAHKSLFFFLDMGLDPNSKIVSGHGPIYHYYSTYPIFKAIELNDPKSIEILLRFGADLSNIEIEEIVNPNRDSDENRFLRTTGTIVKKGDRFEIIKTESYHEEGLRKVFH